MNSNFSHHFWMGNLCNLTWISFERVVEKTFFSTTCISSDRLGLILAQFAVAHAVSPWSGQVLGSDSASYLVCPSLIFTLCRRLVISFNLWKGPACFLFSSTLNVLDLVRSLIDFLQGLLQSRINALVDFQDGVLKLLRECLEDLLHRPSALSVVVSCYSRTIVCQHLYVW